MYDYFQFLTMNDHENDVYVIIFDFLWMYVALKAFKSSIQIFYFKVHLRRSSPTFNFNLTPMKLKARQIKLQQSKNSKLLPGFLNFPTNYFHDTSCFLMFFFSFYQPHEKTWKYSTIFRHLVSILYEFCFVCLVFV